MATFTYKAKNGTGQTVTGVLMAESRQAALRTLADRTLFPIDVTEGGKADRETITGRKRKVKLKVLTGFYSQLADLLRAGVPVLRSLDVLSRTASNPLLSEILKEIYTNVSSGETLADSMAKHPNIFNDLAVAMVRAGEQGGFLEDVLSRIAIFTERQDELRNKLIGSMIYPCVLLFAGVVVVVGLLIGVVPKLRGFMERIEKPLPTKILFAMSDFASSSQGLYALGGLVVLVFVSLPFLKSEKGQNFLERAKMKMPVLGPIMVMVSVCRFCRILGTMLHNGVPILQSLKISKDSAGNRTLAEEIEKASECVQRGEPLAKPLGTSGLFPPDIVDMISVAEESNNLETVLVQIADSNEARTGRQIDLGVRLLEPLMLLVMAVVVLFVAIALLVPILRMSTAGR
ncbi:MAG: type II secretion system F family protein [Phycisphaerae bacterium]|nr:type II secretion system F family protein [Phycisphaerae bacterium]